MTLHIDARGMRCPWPSIRLARALREYDGAVTILADDPAAARELAAVAEAAGRSITRAVDTGAGGDGPVFHVDPVRFINRSFT